MRLVLSDHEFEEISLSFQKLHLITMYFKQNVLQSLLLKVMKQLLSVEVTKFIDINLGSSSAVVLMLGQLEMYVFWLSP